MEIYKVDYVDEGNEIVPATFESEESLIEFILSSGKEITGIYHYDLFMNSVSSGYIKPTEATDIEIEWYEEWSA